MKLMKYDEVNEVFDSLNLCLVDITNTCIIKDLHWFLYWVRSKPVCLIPVRNIESHNSLRSTQWIFINHFRTHLEKPKPTWVYVCAILSNKTTLFALRSGES